MTIWAGAPPKHCDSCEKELEGEFYDAFVAEYELWGYLCPDCFTRYNCKLGLGRGQYYLELEEGTVKVTG